MPGRFSFFHKPGGLAGDHSNFIIGGSHWERHVWRSDHFAEAWSKAAFNLVSFGAGSDAGRTARLARGLDFATAHGMFVLITAQEPGAAAAGMDAHTLIELAANLSCHTNMGTPQTRQAQDFGCILPKPSDIVPGRRVCVGRQPLRRPERRACGGRRRDALGGLLGATVGARRLKRGDRGASR